jgi:hypothetical protein
MFTERHRFQSTRLGGCARQEVARSSENRDAHYWFDSSHDREHGIPDVCQLRIGNAPRDGRHIVCFELCHVSADHSCEARPRLGPAGSASVGRLTGICGIINLVEPSVCVSRDREPFGRDWAYTICNPNGSDD